MMVACSQADAEALAAAWSKVFKKKGLKAGCYAVNRDNIVCQTWHASELDEVREDSELMHVGAPCLLCYSLTRCP